MERVGAKIKRTGKPKKNQRGKESANSQAAAGEEENTLKGTLKRFHLEKHTKQFSDRESAESEIQDLFWQIESLARIAYDHINMNLYLRHSGYTDCYDEFEWSAACGLKDMIEEKAGVIDDALSFLEDEVKDHSVHDTKRLIE